MGATQDTKEPVFVETDDKVNEMRNILKKIFPEAFVEDKLDIEKLKATLGEEAIASSERYNLTWAGKNDCIKLRRTPTRASLAPFKDESIAFDQTSNIFIEGDNLESLKLLYKSYFGKIKTIYIDPPYNTGNDFVYPDNYVDPLETYLFLTGQKDGKGNILTSNRETSGRYHSAWLSMMYPRLFIAHKLLREDGVIFISIDDHEVHNLRMILNEIFGEENFIAQIIVLNNPKGRVLGEHFARCHDYLLVYAKGSLGPELSISKTHSEVEKQYKEVDEVGKYRSLELRNTHRRFGKFNRPNLFYPLYINVATGKVSVVKEEGTEEIFPIWNDGFEGCWTWSHKKVKDNIQMLYGKMVSGRWKIFRKSYAFNDTGDVARKKLKTVWIDNEFYTEKGQRDLDELIPGGVFESPKPVELLKTIIRLSSSDDDIILDFFAGSCTTAQAVLELNREEEESDRRFILIQMPEQTESASAANKAGFQTISDIGKARIRRVISKLRENDHQQKLDPNHESDDLGFRVFKLMGSNYKPWRGHGINNPGEFVKQMELYVDPLVIGWKPENVLFEVATLEGFGLNCEVQKIEGMEDKDLYRVNDPDKDQKFTICLDDEVREEMVQKINLSQNDLFICRDVALSDDLVANLALHCRLKTI